MIARLCEASRDLHLRQVFSWREAMIIFPGRLQKLRGLSFNDIGRLHGSYPYGSSGNLRLWMHPEPTLSYQKWVKYHAQRIKRPSIPRVRWVVPALPLAQLWSPLNVQLSTLVNFFLLVGRGPGFSLVARWTCSSAFRFNKGKQSTLQTAEASLAGEVDNSDGSL